MVAELEKSWEVVQWEAPRLPPRRAPDQLVEDIGAAIDNDNSESLARRKTWTINTTVTLIDPLVVDHYVQVHLHVMINTGLCQCTTRWWGHLSTICRSMEYMRKLVACKFRTNSSI